MELETEPIKPEPTEVADLPESEKHGAPAPAPVIDAGVLPRNKGLLGTLWAALSRQPQARETGLLVVKQTDGRLRWFARYSNAFMDRDTEVITSEAHKEYAAWVSESGLYPELWLWHTKGSRIGEADWVDFDGTFACASGLIDQDREGVVDALKSYDLGVSHGFLAAQQGKYINKYRTFEISPLPRDVAAVWTTDFNVIGKEEQVVGFDAKRRDFLVKALGEEFVTKIEQGSEQTGQTLKQMGVEFKATEEASQADAATQTEARFKTLETQLTEIKTALIQLADATAQASQKASQTEAKVEKDDDQRLEDAFLARVTAAVTKAVRPTEEPASQVTTKEAQQDGVAPGEEDFLSVIAKQLMNATPGNGGGNAGSPATGTVTIQ